MMTGFKITAVITTHVCFEYISELFRVLLDLMITRSYNEIITGSYEIKGELRPYSYGTSN